MLGNTSIAESPIGSLYSINTYSVEIVLNAAGNLEEVGLGIFGGYSNLTCETVTDSDKIASLLSVINFSSAIDCSIDELTLLLAELSLHTETDLSVTELKNIYANIALVLNSTILQESLKTCLGQVEFSTVSHVIEDAIRSLLVEIGLCTSTSVTYSRQEDMVRILKILLTLNLLKAQPNIELTSLCANISEKVTYPCADISLNTQTALINLLKPSAEVVVE